MNNLAKPAIIYSSSFLQGISLILYPAAGSIFISPEFHNLSNVQFGVLFTPQIIFAILASLFANKLTEKKGIKRVLQWGLLANFTSMLLFAGSNIVLVTNPMLPFAFLLLGTAFLGVGFGFTITTLNPLAYHLFPGKEEASVTGLHVFIGIGTATASLLLAIFRNAGWWWGAGGIVGIFLLGLLYFSTLVSLSLPKTIAVVKSKKSKIPFRVWIFVLMVFFFGASEATLGNWSSIYLEKRVGLPATTAALGLTFFWAAITVGRVIFTFIAIRYSTRMLHLIAPVLLTLVFFSFPFLDGELANFIALILGGLCLSFFFPNTISLVTAEFPKLATLVSGLLVAALQLGMGISNNLIGYFSAYISFELIFQYTSIYAAVMASLGGYLYFSKQRSFVKNPFLNIHQVKKSHE